MNEGLRQIGGLWMSIEKVLGPAFEYEVDGGIDESSNSWCGVQDFENEAEFTRRMQKCVCLPIEPRFPERGRAQSRGRRNVRHRKV